MKLAVLVAEGDVSLRAMMCDALEAAGHVAAGGEDTCAALAVLADSPFDVVVSDVAAARVNGLALLEHVKSHADALSVLLVVANDMRAQATAALKAGGDDHITQPVDLADFILRGARLGERRRVEAELRAARASLETTGAGSKLIGRSPLMRALIER